MPKHTPGEWIREGHVVHTMDGTLIADLRRKPPASIFECHIGNMHLEQDEITANADIVAAGGVLLEACKLWYEGYKQHKRIQYGRPWEKEAYQATEAAIAKATGEVSDDS